MPHCVNCGLPIPDGQRTCSMCYGDPEHGSDGYYKAYLIEEARRQAEERLREEARLEEARHQAQAEERLEEEAYREQGGRHVD